MGRVVYRQVTSTGITVFYLILVIINAKLEPDIKVIIERKCQYNFVGLQANNINNHTVLVFLNTGLA